MNVVKDEVVKKQVEKLFIERIENSKVFSNNEICKIKSNMLECEKCFFLGILDKND